MEEIRIIGKAWNNSDHPHLRDLRLRFSRFLLWFRLCRWIRSRIELTFPFCTVRALSLPAYASHLERSELDLLVVDTGSLLCRLSPQFFLCLELYFWELPPMGELPVRCFSNFPNLIPQGWEEAQGPAIEQSPRHPVTHLAHD